MIYAVIMAGGAGTRFWPKSTQARPKQFLNLFGNRTMLQETVERLDGFIDQEQVMVVTNDSYVPIVSDQLPRSKKDFIVGEPVARNTAPCVAAAAAILHNEDPDSVMVVLPADHRIGNRDEFLKILESAVQTAIDKESLVTIGIEPNRPETGYGYIRFDQNNSFESNSKTVFSVKNFTEKPDEENAKMFLESGDYLWNSGMFIWKTGVIIKAFQKHLPEVYKQLEVLANSDCGEKEINEFYNACPSVSIDYGIMEKAESVHVVPGNFDWNDVGSWTAVHELSSKDVNGNATGESVVSIQDSNSNLIHSESGKIVALVGVDNLAVVETEDAILVVNLEKAQGVKQVVEDLKSDKEKKIYL